MPNQRKQKRKFRQVSGEQMVNDLQAQLDDVNARLAAARSAPKIEPQPTSPPPASRVTVHRVPGPGENLKEFAQAQTRRSRNRWMALGFGGGAAAGVGLAALNRRNRNQKDPSVLS